jgi:hypothetical protein
MPTEDFAAQLEEYFRLNCKGKPGCQIPVTRPKKDAKAKGSSTADSGLSELESPHVWTRSVDDYNDDGTPKPEKKK